MKRAVVFSALVSSVALLATSACTSTSLSGMGFNNGYGGMKDPVYSYMMYSAAFGDQPGGQAQSAYNSLIQLNSHDDYDP